MMYKRAVCILLFGLMIIGVASAANNFIINEGFSQVNEYYSINDDNGMTLKTWDYDDEGLREAYLQNDTDYLIVPGSNNTYNITYNAHGTLDSVVAYVNNENISMDHGILEIAEVNGDKYIFMTYMEEGTDNDWKICYDELMKFNENNNIEPMADAI